MKKHLTLIIAAIVILTSCGGGNPSNQAVLDACGCAKVKDASTEDYAKCKELRKDAKFESDFQKCLIAGSSGLDTSRVTIQDAATATNLKAANEGDYMIDAAASHITWYGEKVTGKRHSGLINVAEGTLTMTNGLPSGSITLDMNTLVVTDQTGEGKTKLENHLKSADFFDIAKFNNAKFVIKSATAKNPMQFEIKGDLTIKGITKEATANLVIAPNGQDANLGGGMVFDRSQFDVRYGSDKFFDNLGNDMIKNEITLVFDFKAKRK
ncbi:MAG: YceI family protein [Flavobacteriales bacterium]|nr:YceI family protein [Flavobacteriales bacterium]